MKHLKNIHKHFLFKSLANKKRFKITTLLLLFVMLSSCSSVRVATDYDKEADFNNYKTFAFFKPGIDKAKLNDIDKRRILRAIEAELMAKGYTKSENPDVLVSIFTKSNQRVNVYNNTWGYGSWGWGGYGRWGYGSGFGNQVSTQTEGVLFIDLIDAKKKEMIWQGSGTGYLVTKNVEKKEARIKEFVSQMLTQFPPEKK